LRRGVVLVNRIKEIVDSQDRNPHWLSKRADLSYRVVLKLYKAEMVPASTSIGTLWSIADVLGVTVDELYQPRWTPPNGH
jgi:hypothetical protein